MLIIHYGEMGEESRERRPMTRGQAMRHARRAMALAPLTMGLAGIHVKSPGPRGQSWASVNNLTAERALAMPIVTARIEPEAVTYEVRRWASAMTASIGMPIGTVTGSGRC